MAANVISLMSKGWFSRYETAADDPTLPVSGHQSLSLYSVVTTGDGSVTETVVDSAISGDLQIESRRFVDDHGVGKMEVLWAFYPDQEIDTIDMGYVFYDSNSNKFEVKYVETFDDHQEVYLREQDA